MQTAFSGTQARTGPPVDICLQLLDCQVQPDGKVSSSFLQGVTDTKFFPYQISGAVGLVLKLYGSIEESLFAGTSNQALDMREAARDLEDVKVHGAIMADEVGFGKTKQLLLAAYLHTLLYPQQEAVYKPILLVVPPTLINQWLEEIRDHWPCFTPVVSYEDHDFKEEMALSSISHSAMKEYPSLETLSSDLRYIWDTADKRAATTIIVTSYETHKNRTGRKRLDQIPGKHFTPSRRRENGSVIWKKKPRVVTCWETSHDGAYSLLIADEAQKVKNYSTGIWSVLYAHNFPKTLLATATPIFNSAKVTCPPCPKSAQSPLLPVYEVKRG
jgi:SNF2 family DNA or RNA helicase